MMKKSIVFILSAAVLFTACSTTKHIPEGDALYMGAKVNLTAENITAQQKKVYQADLQGQTRPRPNSRFLGIPFKLLLWNLFYTDSTKGFKAKVQQ
jgi:hypothetical protein